MQAAQSAAREPESGWLKVRLYRVQTTSAEASGDSTNCKDLDGHKMTTAEFRDAMLRVPKDANSFPDRTRHGPTA